MGIGHFFCLVKEIIPIFVAIRIYETVYQDRNTFGRTPCI